MMPFLTFPLALLGLASLPALVGLYALQNRRKPRVVSALFLWEQQRRSPTTGRELQPPRFPLLFFLELIILALLALAAADPRLLLPSYAPPLCLILDNSFSMEPVADRAREAARELIASGMHRRVRVFLAGSEASALGEADYREAVALLGAWTATAQESDLDGAIALAKGASGRPGRIVVLTDHEPPEPYIDAENLEWRAFGKAIGNVAIVNAASAASDGAARCLIEVANLADGPATQTLRLSDLNGALLQTEELRLGPEESRRLRFALPAAIGVRATLKDDALLADNAATLLPEVRQPARVLLRFNNTVLDGLVRRALEATGRAILTERRPELLITDQPGALAGEAATWTLCLVASESPTPYIGPYVLDRAHPLTTGLQFQGLVWAAGAVEMPGQPLALVGEIPLMSSLELANGRQQAWMQYSPQLSSLHRSIVWPGLFANALDWRAAAFPGPLERNGALGGLVQVRTSRDSVEVQPPSGEARAVPAIEGRAVFAAQETGVYRVADGIATWQVSINALNRRESDLRQAARGEWGEWGPAEGRMEFRSLAWMLFLGALGLLLGHQWLLARSHP